MKDKELIEYIVLTSVVTDNKKREATEYVSSLRSRIAELESAGKVIADYFEGDYDVDEEVVAAIKIMEKK